MAAAPVWAAAPQTGLSGYSSRVWRTQDGLPEATIQAMAQTPDGYLWIGTTGGLVRFDGVRFTVFNRENTALLRENSVSALLAARDGALWVGTQGGGVLRYSGGAFRAYGAGQGLENEFVSAIYQDRVGTLWVGAEWGLYRLEKERFLRADMRNGIPGMWVHAAAEDADGRLWLAGAGLVAVSPAGTKVYYNGRRADFFRAIAPDPDGTVWAGSITGLERLDRGGTAFTKAAPRDRVVRALLRDSNGNLWIGTTAGLILQRDGTQTLFTAPEALPDNQVLAALEDSEHNLWFGTGNGLLCWRPGAPAVIDRNENIRTVYRDPDGTLWVTAASGRVFQVAGGRLVQAQLPAEVRTLPVRTVFRDRSGGLWLGTGGLGVVHVEHGRATRHASHNGGPTNGFVTAFCEDGEGAMWIGTEGGLARFRGGRIDKYHPFRADYGPGFRGLPYATVRALVAARDGDLWIGTDGGLARFRDGKFAFDPVIDRMRGEKVWAIHEDPASCLWLGTRGNGLFRVCQGKLVRFTTANGLASNYIYQVLGNGAGGLWLASPGGIFSATGSRPETVRLDGMFRGMDGQIPGGIQPSGAVAGDGGLWMATSTGVVHVAPGLLAPRAVPPALIEQVVADGRRVTPGPGLRLGPGDGELEIGYTAVRLATPEGLRFRYRLEGFDEGWVEAVNNRVAHYTNLRPGRYVFRVHAYDSSAPGKSSEAALPVVWLPYVYQTWWFRTLLAAAAVAAGWQVYLALARRQRLRAALMEERNRLAREMHDTLVQGCVGACSMLDAAGALEGSAPERARELVRAAREQVHLTIDEARRAIWNLRSRSAAGFGARLTELSHGIGRDGGVAIRVDVRGTPEKLEPGTEDNLLLVAREALQNAVRHAAPTRIGLEVRYSREAVEMRIADNGTGFDAAAAGFRQSHHYGLVGMRERVETLGGCFELTSKQGRGTVVRLRVPLPANGGRRA